MEQGPLVPVCLKQKLSAMELCYWVSLHIGAAFLPQWTLMYLLSGPLAQLRKRTSWRFRKVNQSQHKWIKKSSTFETFIVVISVARGEWKDSVQRMRFCAGCCRLSKRACHEPLNSKFFVLSANPSIHGQFAVLHFSTGRPEVTGNVQFVNCSIVAEKFNGNLDKFVLRITQRNNEKWCFIGLLFAKCSTFSLFATFWQIHSSTLQQDRNGLFICCLSSIPSLFNVNTFMPKSFGVNALTSLIDPPNFG